MSGGDAGNRVVARPDSNRPVAPPAGAGRGGWSLRTRLLAGVLGLVVAALAAFGVGTALLLRAQQLARADERLADITAREVVQERFRGRGPGGAGGARGGGPLGQQAPGGIQPGSIALLVLSEDGEVTESLPAGFRQDPEPLPAVGGLTFEEAVRAAGPYTVGAEGDPTFRYRVRVDPLPAARQTVVYGVPLAQDDATLTRLLVLEVAGGAVVVLVAALIGLRIIGVGLRPLDAMTETATAIAAGDLGRRVGPDGGRSDEVGRLGRALDTMLARIDAAFAERAGSEGRLRRFVADASHELRTPLTTIRGYAELHRRGMLPSDEVDDAMRRIEAEATRMGTLVEDLLLLARLDEGRALERRRVDLAVVAADAVRDLRATAPERAVGLQADEPVVVEGDPARLHQVVANLLDNARRHTPPGTAVEVRATIDGAEAVVAVADRGPGIDADIAAHIFDRSFRGNRTASPTGSGLGLSIVAAVIAAHGGSVTVDRTPGGGATFVVRLPLAGDGPPGQPDDRLRRG